MAAADLASQKIAEANILLDKIGNFVGVKGTSKLQKRIKAEIKFLNKAKEKGSELKEKHVLCSNLGQLGAIYDAASQVSKVTGVLQNFSAQYLEKILVDVVADDGKQWIKVILRCPKALHLLYVMGGRRGVKPLDEVAEDFLIMAENHPVFYSVPQVVFWFFRGVSESLAKDLEDLGVLVKGSRIPDEDLGIPDFTVEDSDAEFDELSEEDALGNTSLGPQRTSHELGNDINDRLVNSSCTLEVNNCEAQDLTERQNTVDITSDGSCLLESNRNSPLSDNTRLCEDAFEERINDKEIKKLNLDVTSIIAYVSATTNGGANFVFTDKVLTEQAMWERQNPVKEVLEQYFKDCELLMCQEAVDHFSEIIDTIGGPAEKERAYQFLKKVTVVPGQDVFEDQIKIGGKVRKLSRVIFGTGHANRAITVTSNRGFVRSVEQQGIRPVVLYHEPRALTEMKETTATLLEIV